MALFHMLLTFLVAFSPLCTSTKVLPREDYSGTQSRAFEELRDIIIHPRGSYAGELPLRLHFPAKRLMAHASSPQNSAAVAKRTLLGIRQSCNAGFGYCYASGKCCPNSDGNGKCCDDGTCVDGKTQTCCLYGSACSAGTTCCKSGCAPQGTECCGDSTHCDPGFYCCGNNKCAPNGGECCADGSVCPSGKHCVIFDGQQTCCTDLSCKEFKRSSSGDDSGDNSGSGGTGGRNPPPPIAPPSYSIPDITIPSFNPADYPTLAAPTLPSLPPVPTYGGAGAGAGSAPAPAVITGSTFPTFTASFTGNAPLQTFSTTLTIYYYTVFITTTTFVRTESAFVTSSFTSRKTQITALATDSLDAQLVFDTVDLSLLDGATATVTGSGVADFSQTHVRSSASRRTGSQSTGTTVAAGGSGAESGQFSAAGKLSGAWDWRLWVWGMVGIGVGVGMVVI